MVWGLVFINKSYPNVLAHDGIHLIYFVLTLFPAAHFKPKIDPRDADHNRRFIRKLYFKIFFTRVRFHVPRLSPKVATGIHCRLSGVTKIRLLGLKSSSYDTRNSHSLNMNNISPPR